MRQETAIVVWWAIGWGGCIDASMLSAMRRCSMRGARETLSVAADHGWFRRWYIHKRCVIYQVTDAGRAMCISMGMPVPTSGKGLQHRIVDGKFIPSKNWEHARQAAIATAKYIEERFWGAPITPDWVVPMFLIGKQDGQKTPDCMLVGSDQAIALEFERSEKRGRQAHHRNWMTLAHYIGAVSADEVQFQGVPIKEVVVAHTPEIAAELRRTLDRYCRDITKWRHKSLWWTWFDGTQIRATGALFKGDDED